MGKFLFNFCTIFFLYSIFYFQYEFMFLWCIIWEREHKLKILNLKSFFLQVGLCCVFLGQLLSSLCFKTEEKTCCSHEGHRFIGLSVGKRHFKNNCSMKLFLFLEYFFSYQGILYFIAQVFFCFFLSASQFLFIPTIY